MKAGNAFVLQQLIPVDGIQLIGIDNEGVLGIVPRLVLTGRKSGSRSQQRQDHQETANQNASLPVSLHETMVRIGG